MLVKGTSMIKRAAFCLILSLLFLTGCASGPPKGWSPEEKKTILNLPYDQAWQHCLTALAAKGYDVDTADKSRGLITTAKQVARFDPAQEDCGNILNLPFLKEKPGEVSITYQISLREEGSKTAITIGTDIRPLSPPLVHTHSIETFCYSTGILERALQESVLAGQPK